MNRFSSNESFLRSTLSKALRTKDVTPLFNLFISVRRKEHGKCFIRWIVHIYILRSVIQKDDSKSKEL